jgi:hypothetical protein
MKNALKYLMLFAIGLLVVGYVFRLSKDSSERKSVQSSAKAEDKVSVTGVKTPATTQVDTSERLLEVTHEWQGVHIPIGYECKYTVAENSHILVRKNQGKAIWATESSHEDNVQTIEWRLSKGAPHRETLTFEIYKKG